MGQQPNIEQHLAAAPRQKLAPGVARGWKPDRPGDMTTPASVPSGGSFGVIGPDAGYALLLVARRTLKLLPGEHAHDAEAALAAIATARAARDGRAPIADDVTVAMVVLGFDAGASVDPGVLGRRPEWIANVGHDDAKLRALVADIPRDVLAMNPEPLREHVASGWAFRA